MWVRIENTFRFFLINGNGVQLSKPAVYHTRSSTLGRTYWEFWERRRRDAISNVSKSRHISAEFPKGKNSAESKRCCPILCEHQQAGGTAGIVLRFLHTRTRLTNPVPSRSIEVGSGIGWVGTQLTQFPV